MSARDDTHRQKRTVLTIGLCVLALWTSMAQTTTPTTPVAHVRYPLIELAAPRAFDPDQTRGRLAAVFRIDATVLFPLFSIPIAHRDDVGFATVSMRDHESRSGISIRSYELFAASFPERARGLNRTGFFREVVGSRGDRPRWTAHFGALSSNPEASRSEVRLDTDESVQSYTVLDGMANTFGATNRDTRLELTGSWISAPLFYQQLVPAWRATAPEPEVQRRSGTGSRLGRPVGFLGVLHEALEGAADDLGRSTSPRLTRYSFVHKAQPMTLELDRHRVDDGWWKRYDEYPVVERSVHRLDFRIFDENGRRVQSFSIWVELPDTRTSRESVPFSPVGFVVRVKSFLELHAVRIPE